jgi:hypothetical protein
MVFFAQKLERPSHGSRRWRSLEVLALVVSTLVGGCSQNNGDLPSLPSGGFSPISIPGSCTIPGTGCSCSTEGETQDCGQAIRKGEGTVDCSVGTMQCTGGVWGSCSVDGVVTRDTNNLLETLRPEALGKSSVCLDDPCNPYCFNYIDTAVGLKLPDGGIGESADGGLILQPHQRIVKATGTGTGSTNSCVGLQVIPPTQTVTVTDINPVTYPLGEYFNAENYTSSGKPTSIPTTQTPAGTRNDPNIDFNWSSGAPGVGGLGATNFSVRWTGVVIPATTDNYTFTLSSDDGGRMWLSGTLIIDKWVTQSVTGTTSASVRLVAGQKYDFKVEYFQATGGDEVHLAWSSSTFTNQIIPSQNLGPPSSSAPPITVSPATVVYTANALPAAHCGSNVTAAWTLDKLSTATIDNTGTFQVVSPVAGPIQVKGIAGTLFNTGTANVVVAAVDTRNAPTGVTASTFTGTSTTTDPTLTVLYPYANTVFPVGTAPPLVQWSNGGVAATAVKVGLRYPATGTPTFSWDEIIAEPSTPQATIPANVWSAFEQTAKGSTGAIAIQRSVAGVLFASVTRPIKFSTAPLRGRIVYTEYLRSPQAATIRSVDPSGAASATAVFTNGCPVCHSMSANGAMFATSKRSYSTNGGISSISASGTFTNLFDVPSDAQYQVGTNDWRGFAWAPLSPDGQFLLYASNFWGNTVQTTVGIDTTNRVVNTPLTYQSAGTGIGLYGQYYTGTAFAGTPWVRTDPGINFSWGTSSPGGPTPATNYSVKWTGQLQALFTETVTFTITSTDAFKLALGSTAVIDQSTWAGSATATAYTGTANLVAGQYYNLTLTDAHTTGTQSIKMQWGGTLTPTTVVPPEQLYSSTQQYGLLVSYYNNTTFAAPAAVTRIEPTAGANWGSLSPDPAIGVDNFSDVWTGQLEAPYTGTYTFYIANDDTGHVEVNNTVVCDTAVAHTVASPLTCTTTLNLTAGQKYPLKMTHVETSSTAMMLFYWSVKSGTTVLLAKEFVPMEHLYPPTTYVAPTNGLWASYYGGNKSFNRALSAYGSQVANGTVKAFQRIDPLINFNWGTTPPMAGTFGSNSAWNPTQTAFSVRWAGQVLAPCTGTYEFRAIHDDYARIYVGGTRVLSNVASIATDTGAVYLTGGQSYDFKVDYQQTSSSASIEVQWSPPVACNASQAFVDVPTANLFPGTYNAFAGVARDGGDNSNGYNYNVFSMTASTTAATDVTANSKANWGLEGATMMVPAFSPDSTKLAYISGDQSDGAGWRKGIGMFDYDQPNQVFKNRRLITSTFPNGNVMRWPTFEGDSHSLVVSNTPPASFCCINSWTHYGFMGPTDYYETPGWLTSIDTTATTPTAVPLANLNVGERTLDANKSFQPTMLPVSAGGYRWVVFTSTRPYGNTLNLTDQQDYTNPSSFSPMLVPSSVQSMLWVAAIDDTPSGSVDRSHPAYFLPDQHYSSTPATGYVNERGFWTLDPCTASGGSCIADDDCCGGTGTSPTATCRIDLPLTSVVTRHCAGLPSPTSCAPVGAFCQADGDCCGGTSCVAQQCYVPPPTPTYQQTYFVPGNFTRLYQAVCPAGTTSQWDFVFWTGVAPSSSYVEFYVQPGQTSTGFAKLPLVPTNVTASGVVSIGRFDSTWTGPQDLDVYTPLSAAGQSLVNSPYLYLTMRLSPATDQLSTPSLSDWKVSYSCVPSE